MTYITERCLTFKYSGDNKIENSKKLSALLKDNNIDFVCYLETGNYYPCMFVVRRSKRKWNDIMKLVNSIQAPKYDYITSNFYITDKMERNNIGNMQELVFCR